MENREEIKNGVKQRVIEFMAEQITTEDSFAKLKSELIEEFFSKKETKPVIKDEKPTDLKTMLENRFLENKLVPPTDTYGASAIKSESSLQAIKDRQASYYKKIIDAKLGVGVNQNIINVIKNIQDKDSKSYADVLDYLSGKNVPSYNNSIIDPRLKGELSHENIERLRTAAMADLKDTLSNPFANDLEFVVKHDINEDNYHKSYFVNDKNKDFKLECSYIYNKKLNHKYIDKFFVDSKGVLLHGEELEIPFAIEAMDLMVIAEKIRDKAIKALERTVKQETSKKESPKKTIPNKKLATTAKKPQVKGK